MIHPLEDDSIIKHTKYKINIMKNSTSNGSVLENLESPFLHLTNFKQPQSNLSTSVQSIIPIHSPFKSVYELEGIEQGYDADKESFVALMDELYDEDFDGFIQEIANEAQNFYENHVSNRYGGLQNNEAMVRRSLDEHFAPVLNEVDRFMDYSINIANQHDSETMTEVEWDHLMDQFTMQMETSPEIEHWGFFKKLAKKAVKSVRKKVKKVFRRAKGFAKKWKKKGIRYVKEKGVAFVMNGIKKYARSILTKVLKWGLNKLPAKYRPLANLVAKKMGILKEVSEYEENEMGIYFQQELNGMIAQLLLVPNEMELELMEEEFLNEEEFVDNSLIQLEEAREVFVSELGTLEEDESSEPAIERFAPVVMAALKLGIRFYGRDKLIGKVANPVSNLIKKYIGKQNALILSKLLVDAGFRLFNLELSEEEQGEQGTRAVAAVVEETIGQLAQLPEHVWENEALLEANIVQAFETAAKTNFPDILPDDMYAKRPNLRESSKYKVAWKMKAIGKGKRKKCHYKKLTKEIETEITPYIAQEIKTFEGVSLDNILRDQLGVVVNRRIPVKVHLYETLAGANRSHIGRYERSIQGLGNPNVVSQLIHPLTSVAAGLLMGEPALGCKSKTKCLAHKHSNKSHRYYYLEIPNARPQMYTDSSGIAYLRKTTGLKLKLDFIKNKIQLFLFMSERDAQSMASQMRQNMEGNAVRLSNMAIESGLKAAFSKHASNNIMIVHPKVVPGKLSGKAIEYIPSIIQKRLQNKLKEWTEANVSNHFMSGADEFIKAVDLDSDGVTICITMEAPSDFKVMGQFINQQKAQIPENIFSEQKLEMIIKVKPGYQYV